MPLDPQAQVLLDQLAAAGDRKLADMTVAEARQTFALMAALATPGPDLDEARNESADGVPVRVYRPTADRPLPAIVYFHGGGFVIGDLATHDATCRDLALRTGMVVVSVDYRLAPEHVFPAAADDASTATRWVHDHAGELGVDPARIAVAGDSAGGNLAAVATLDARERGGPPLAFQLLIYPCLDATMTQPSIDENAEGYLLQRDSMQWFYGHYAREADVKDQRLSPLHAADLAGLPPALVITAEFDPLRDEGEAYGERLRDGGVPVTVSRYDGMIHGFFGMTAVLDAARAAMDEAVAALRAVLAV